jgi:hypothetical protein
VKCHRISTNSPSPGPGQIGDFSAWDLTSAHP